MTRQEKLKLLTEWKTSYIKLDKSFDKLSDAIGCSLVESNIFNNSFMMFDRYTKTVAMLLDQPQMLLYHVEDLLSWYCYENAMGKNSLKAKANSWKNAIEIKTINDLLNIIEAE